MNTKTVYTFNQDGEYTGEGLAYEDPEVPGSYPLPHGATDKKPPAATTGKIARWTGDQLLDDKLVEGKWEVVDDHREETVYDTVTGDEITVDYLGEIKPEHTTIAPGPYQKWVNGKWIDRPLTPEEQIQELNGKKWKILGELQTTDYIATKIAEGAATAEEYKDQIAARQVLRDEINKIQEQIAELEKNLKG